MSNNWPGEEGRRGGEEDEGDRDLLPSFHFVLLYMGLRHMIESPPADVGAQEGRGGEGKGLEYVSARDGARGASKDVWSNTQLKCRVRGRRRGEDVQKRYGICSELQTQ